MCLIALALGQSERWPLVIASNRDEYFHRPTLPLQRWHGDAGEPIISGRDLQAGGTWLGVTPKGRVAMLTNVREPGMAAGPRSRGDLPLAWLTSAHSSTEFFRGLNPQAYSGFNLLVGDALQGEWHWVSNRQHQGGTVVPGWQHQRLGPGVYGLSNAFLDTPWPKTLGLKAALAESLREPDPPPDRLWHALTDTTVPHERDLPRTGVAPGIERQLGPAFVRFDDGRYGTRASSLVLAQAQAQGVRVQVHERTWAAQGPAQERSEQLDWPGFRSPAPSQCGEARLPQSRRPA